MKLLKAAAIVASFVVCSAANSATIDFGEANYSSGDGTAFKSVWDGIEDSDKTITSLTEFTNINSDNNTIMNLNLGFVLGRATNIDFRFGIDGGYGASVYLNGDFVSERIEDLWWSNNYSNNDVVTTDFGTSAAGSYTLDLYWAENGQSGNQSAQFTVDGGDTWQTLSVDNLAAVSAVPEASTYALMLSGLGFVGLMVRRRKKAA